MPEMTLDEAIARLREHGGYEWLISGPEAFLAADIAEHLNKTGIKVTRETVGRWIKNLPHTQDFGRLGLSASRRDLLVFFAEKMRDGSRAASDD